MKIFLRWCLAAAIWIIGPVGWAAPCDRACLDNALAGGDKGVVLEMIPQLSEVVRREQALAIIALLDPDHATPHTTIIALPKKGDVFIDGWMSANRPNNVGSLLQQRSSDGSVLLSIWLMPGDPLPVWESERRLAKVVGRSVGTAGKVILGILVMEAIIISVAATAAVYAFLGAEH